MDSISSSRGTTRAPGVVRIVPETDPPGTSSEPAPVLGEPVESGEPEEPSEETGESEDRAASGAPSAGWALEDRFSWSEIYERLLASAIEEVDSNRRELFFSGLTAGFAIVLTLIGHAVGVAHFPENPFLASALYPIGFIYIILGRYQLFTENTLPPVMLVLTRLGSVPLLLRVWTWVLVANVVGAALGALVVGHSGVLSPEAMEAGASLASHAHELPWTDVFLKAVFAGWLVAGVVWLGTASRDTVTRFLLVYFAFYIIAAAELYHVVTSAAEVVFYVAAEASGPGLGLLFRDLWLPVLLGNTVGGVLVFTLVTYAQAPRKSFPEVRELTLREMLFTFEGALSEISRRPLTSDDPPK